MDDFGSAFFDFVPTAPPQNQYCNTEFTNGGSFKNMDPSQHFPTTTIKQEYSSSSMSSSSTYPNSSVDHSQDGNSLDFILDNTPEPPKPKPPVVIAASAPMKIPTTKIGVSCISQSPKTIFIPLQNNNSSSLKTVRIIKATSIAQNNLPMNIKSINSPVSVKNIIPMQKQSHIGGYVPQITQRHQLVCYV